MRSYRMTLAYDGAAYSGWQVQTGANTVQAAVEAALQRIVGQPVRVVASGRTDAGVHAAGQVASFCCHTRLTPDVLCRAVEANTPDDICVLQIVSAPDGFHAIRDAISKRYRYVIQDGRQRDLFLRAYSWHVPYQLHVPVMREAAAHLVGRHDFSGFEAAGSPRKSSVRTVSDLRIERAEQGGGQPITLEISANGFLYNMVRNIVGSLVLVGRGRQSAAWIAEVLAAKDRKLAGPTAPACGLMLMDVQYGEKD